MAASGATLESNSLSETEQGGEDETELVDTPAVLTGVNRSSEEVGETVRTEGEMVAEEEGRETKDRTEEEETHG